MEAMLESNSDTIWYTAGVIPAVFSVRYVRAGPPVCVADTVHGSVQYGVSARSENLS